MNNRMNITVEKGGKSPIPANSGNYASGITGGRNSANFHIRNLQ